MKCSDARPLLDILCDGALEAKDSALVLEHLRICVQCQSEWQAMEELHVSFQQAKNTTQIPPNLMDRVADTLKDEERKQQKSVFSYVRNVSLITIAASILLIGTLVFFYSGKFSGDSAATQLASAGTLIDDLSSQATVEPFLDRNELAKRIGYEIRYVKLPSWHMDRAGLYKPSSKFAIARFDFVRQEQSGIQRLTCYQAQQGTIRAEGAQRENIDGKQVLLGHHGKLQYALWSQNGRDYLFVTSLPSSDLVDIIRGA